MSERKPNEKFDWDQATKKAEEETIFNWPEGNTTFKPIAGEVEKSSLSGKYLVTVDMDDHIRKVSMSSKIFSQMAKEMAAGAIEFSMMRIGTAMQDTRYKLSVVRPLKKVK